MIEFNTYFFNNPKWVEITMIRKIKPIGSINVVSAFKIPLDLFALKLLCKNKLNSNKYRFIRNIYGGM